MFYAYPAVCKQISTKAYGLSDKLGIFKYKLWNTGRILYLSLSSLIAMPHLRADRRETNIITYVEHDKSFMTILVRCSTSWTIYKLSATGPWCYMSLIKKLVHGELRTQESKNFKCNYHSCRIRGFTNRFFRKGYSSDRTKWCKIAKMCKL